MIGVMSKMLRMVTVEPAMLLVFMAFSLQLFITQDLILNRTCTVNLGYSPDTCANLTINATLNNKVQSKATYIITYNSILECLPSIILALILGPLSDRYGRKIPMLYNVSVAAVAAAVLLVCSLKSDWRAEYILIAAIIRGCSGNVAIFTMTVYSYLSIITSQRDRMLRIAIADGTMAVGLSLGMYLSGVIAKVGNYYSVYTAAVACLTLAFFYLAIRIKEQSCANRSSSSHTLVVEVKDICKLVWWQRTGSRMKLFILTLAMVFSASCMNAEISVFYLYVSNGLGWSATSFTQFASLLLFLRAFVTTLIMVIFNGYLRVHETLLGTIGNTMTMVSLLILAFTSGSVVFVLSLLLLGTFYVSSPVIRTTVSKTVPGEHIGQVFSVLSTVEAAVPLAATPFTMYIYRETLSEYKGAVFLVIAAFQLCISVIFVWLYRDFKKHGESEHLIDEVTPLLT